MHASKDKPKSIAKRNEDRQRPVSSYKLFFFFHSYNNYYFEGLDDQYLTTVFNKDKDNRHRCPSFSYPVYSLLLKNSNTSSNNYGKALNLLKYTFKTAEIIVNVKNSDNRSLGSQTTSSL